MDDATVQLLQDLPPVLRERDWQLVASESAVLAREIPRYKAVYVCPFDGRLDLENPSSVAYDQRTRQQIVRVSTQKDCSPSWRGTHRDAIRRTRKTGAKRRRRR